jgi:excisionase family DNA binding protein
MNVSERVAELLAGVAIEDILRGREVAEAGKIIGIAVPTVYRAIADRRLGHVKVEGRSRKGRGHAGIVRVRLLDCITFMVQNEVTPGTATKARRSA